MNAAQAAEVAKYEVCYRNESYRMGADRRRQCEAMMANPAAGATFLDVGCGRGETMEIAERLGYADWWGVEAVDALLSDRVVRGVAWRLPWPSQSVHTVACFDVLEHLLPGDESTVGDDQLCVLDMLRVATSRVLLSIGLYPSTWGGGPELHVNLRTPEEWTALLRIAAGDEWSVLRRADLDVAGINAAWELVRVP